MANPEHFAKLVEGVDAWNAWRQGVSIGPDLSVASFNGADLAGIDLSNANMKVVNLEGASLRGANLGGANLSHSYLRGCDLSNTNLGGAILHGAELIEARLNGASLIQADLRGADLSRADLSGTILLGAGFGWGQLRHANFTGALFGWVGLNDVDVSQCIGLDSLVHQGPSSIGVDTILRSGGEISRVFLRGAGVLESVIEAIPSLIMGLESLRYDSCFISHSSMDKDFVSRLHSDLREAGVRCWFAPEDLRGGRKIHEQIDNAIREYDRVLLVLSEASLTSEWVKHEIRKALQREKDAGRRVLFPIRLVSFERLKHWELIDEDSGRDMAREVRSYFIPDLSEWEISSRYGTGLRCLLRDLNASISEEFVTDEAADDQNALS